MSVQHILQQILASLICHQKGLQEWCDAPPLDRPSFCYSSICFLCMQLDPIQFCAKKRNFSRRRKFSPCFLPPSSSHTPPHTHTCPPTHTLQTTKEAQKLNASFKVSKSISAEHAQDSPAPVCSLSYQITLLPGSDGCRDHWFLLWLKIYEHH